MIAGRLPLGRLKRDTADLHARAERHVRILDPNASVADYVRYLRAMHGYHAPLEEMFGVSAALAAIGFDASSRRRAPLLEQDLRVLGAVEPSPHCSSLPAAESIAGLLGIAYVLEGSTLGGRFILSRLPPALAPLRGTATAFLVGYGAATGARWRAFGEVVERGLATPTDIDVAVGAARVTFARLVDWLASSEPPRSARARRPA